MTPERQALVGYRLERARETIEEARILLDAGHTNACVNRLYYACFYAVSALLLTLNISTSKHSYARSLLHRDYVKPGHISKEMGDHYDLLFDSRHKGDYEDFIVFNPTSRIRVGFGFFRGGNPAFRDRERRLTAAKPL